MDQAHHNDNELDHEIEHGVYNGNSNEILQEVLVEGTVVRDTKHPVWGTGLPYFMNLSFIYW